jgi:4-hydroxy-3-methylbut-2-enyl diphosphate reductase IspH
MMDIGMIDPITVLDLALNELGLVLQTDNMLNRTKGFVERLRLKVSSRKDQADDDICNVNGTEQQWENKDVFHLRPSEIDDYLTLLALLF